MENHGEQRGGSYGTRAKLLNQILEGLNTIILCGRFSRHSSATQVVPRILCELLAFALFSSLSKDPVESTFRVNPH